MTEQEYNTLELRRKYLGYCPWQLAQSPGDPILWEFTSYPWRAGEGGELVQIMARRIGDPASNRSFLARKQIHPVRWSEPRERAYREGFGAGMVYAAQEARKFREAAK